MAIYRASRRRIILFSVILLASALAIWLAITTTFAAPRPESSEGEGESAAQIAASLPELISRVLEREDLTEVELEVLARAEKSGQIPEQDYLNAHEKYVSCMRDAGFQPEYRRSQFGFFVELPYEGIADSQLLDQSVASCSEGYDIIDNIYRIQAVNPKLLSDMNLVAVECLRREGGVDASYSDENFEQDLAVGEFPFDSSVDVYVDCLWGAGVAYFDLKS